MVHGGRISYALYLVHIPMFEIFWFLSDSGVLPRGGETGHLIALTVFVGTLPVAHLLYSLVERPARRWMRGRARPTPGAVEAALRLIAALRARPAARDAGVLAVPAVGNAPTMWLLGSSGYSAKVAGMLGLPFAFAHHFSAANTLPALELYREHFRPSALLAQPYSMIAAAVTCAVSRVRMPGRPAM